MSKLVLKLTGLREADGLKVAGVVGLSEEESIRNGEKKFVYVVLQSDGSVAYPTCKIS